MTTEIRITGFTVHERMQNNGSFRLGFFDVQVPPLHMHGCLLALDTSGRLVAFAPQLQSRDGGSRGGIRFIEQGLRRRVAEAAHAAYMQLGGTCMPGEIPSRPAPDDDDDRQGLDRIMAGANG